jgi:hypothetical protein
MELEQVLHLGAPALLIVASREIEGYIVQYSAEVRFGYQMTIDEARLERGSKKVRRAETIATFR